jgi:predicted enzyme related to lactoylglutathione lyase
MHKPSADGVKVYFNGNPDLNEALSKVAAAGGKITVPKNKIDGDIAIRLSLLIQREMLWLCTRKDDLRF